MLCPACQTPMPEGALFCSACGARQGGLSAGFLVGGRYEILEPLGQGGMGTVYKAHDRMLREDVALKVLRTDVASTPELAQRFIQEIRLARKVSHKGVCRIHEYSEDGELRYISMAFVDGTDLKRVLRERGRFSIPQAYELSIRIAEALQAIHDEGIVHRDLKTPNVMIDARGFPTLMDFGIAKRWESAGTELTGTGMIVGTPEYMSPEQIRAQKVDLRSDIYSLGILVFEIFTGHAPFRADTPVALLMKHLQQPAPLDGVEAAELPPLLVPVLRKALAKDPADRYSSAAEMAEALRRAWDAAEASGAAPTLDVCGATVAMEVAAPEVAASPRVIRPPRLGSWAAALLGLALVLASTAAALGVWLYRIATRADPPAPAPGPPAVVTTSTLATPQPMVAPSDLAAATPRPTAVPPDTTSAPRPPTPEASAPPPAPARVGTLLVVVVPWGDVTVDGAAVETGPGHKIRLTPGSHLVRVVHPEFQPFQRRLAIKAGETVRLTIDLPEEAFRKVN